MWAPWMRTTGFSARFGSTVRAAIFSRRRRPPVRRPRTDPAVSRREEPLLAARRRRLPARRQMGGPRGRRCVQQRQPDEQSYGVLRSGAARFQQLFRGTRRTDAHVRQSVPDRRRSRRVPPINVVYIAPDRVNAYNVQWSASVQRQLSESTVVEVAYVGSQASHLDNSRNLNDAPPGPVPLQPQPPLSALGHDPLSGERWEVVLPVDAVARRAPLQPRTSRS